MTGSENRIKATNTHKTGDWATIKVPEIVALPASVFLRSQNLSAREVFPPHTHGWNQLVYATSGALVVTVAGARHVITPEQAIWVPTGVVHTTGTFSGATFRTLYVADTPGLDMPGRCTVYAVSSLLRALILELEQLALDAEVRANSGRRSDTKDAEAGAGYADKLNGLILEQLRRLNRLDFHLPWPQSAPLRKVCETLYANPADERSLDDWALKLNVSSRTLARRFARETGTTLRAWRHRLRLFLALEWLCAGRHVTDIALDLGYASPSAFTYMFRQEMGCPPTEWRGR